MLASQLVVVAATGQGVIALAAEQRDGGQRPIGFVDADRVVSGPAVERIVSGLAAERVVAVRSRTTAGQSTFVVCRKEALRATYLAGRRYATVDLAEENDWSSVLSGLERVLPGEPIVVDHFEHGVGPGRDIGVVGERERVDEVRHQAFEQPAVAWNLRAVA